MGTLGWVNHLHLKQTSKVSYSGFLKWPFSVYPLWSIKGLVEIQACSSTQQESYLKWQWKEAMKISKFLKGQKKKQRKQVMQVVRKHNWISFALYVLFRFWGVLFVSGSSFKFMKSPMSNWRIFKKLKF